MTGEQAIPRKRKPHEERKGARTVTEVEWLACTDPTPMLEFLRGKASERKLRLFAVACCRRLWPLLIDERSQCVAELVEQYADRLTTRTELVASQAHPRRAVQAVRAAGRNAKEAAQPRSPLLQKLHPFTQFVLVACPHPSLICIALVGCRRYSRFQSQKRDQIPACNPDLLHRTMCTP